MDANKDFEITQQEFHSHCGQGYVANKLFEALDAEGAAFQDDEAAMANMEKRIMEYTVDGTTGMDYTPSFMVFREIAKTARLPRSLTGDGKLSLGVLQESRHLDPTEDWPYSNRIVRRFAEDLPRDFGGFQDLYLPESVLAGEVCGDYVDTDTALELIGALSNKAVIPSAYDMEGLFRDYCGHDGLAPGPATTRYLFDSYSSDHCPESWQGKFICSSQTQIPQGIPDYPERDPSFLFPDLYTGKTRRFGDDYASSDADAIPGPVGTYKSGKMRLGIALLCRGMIELEELSRSLCNHSDEGLAAAMMLDDDREASSKSKSSKGSKSKDSPSKDSPSMKSPSKDSMSSHSGSSY